jgi:hypothetical protein
MSVVNGSPPSRPSQTNSTNHHPSLKAQNLHSNKHHRTPPSPPHPQPTPIPPQLTPTPHRPQTTHRPPKMHLPTLLLAHACIPNGDCVSSWIGYDCSNEGDRETFKRNKKNAGINCWNGPGLGVGCNNECGRCPC